MRYLIAILLLFSTGCVKEPGLEEVESIDDILEEATQEAHTITLRPNKKIEMNGKVFDADAIATLLQESNEKKDSVILKVDHNTIANDVVRAVDEIKSVGFEKIYVSTFEDDE